jgi:hypothetical protein
MKWLKAGPELKMPDLRNLKLPAFVEDLYFDLKDRRLLPLVALGIVAIVAAPILLSQGSSEPAKPAPVVRGTASSGPGANASLTVVRAEPGLRAYRKRLHRKPVDPFKQRFTAPQLAGTHLGSGEDEAATATGTTGGASPSMTSTATSTSTRIEANRSTVTKRVTREENGTVTSESETQTSHPPGAPGPRPTEGSTGSGSGGSEGTEGTTGPESGEPHWIAFAVDVKVKTAVTLPDGTVEKGEPVTKSGLRPPEAIPNAKEPVVSFLGADLKTGKLVVMVSEEVTSVFGEGKCLMGTRSCQLLEVEAGMPTTFVYGPAGKRFKITFTKIERVPVELPKNLEQSPESP